GDQAADRFAIEQGDREPSRFRVEGRDRAGFPTVMVAVVAVVMALLRAMVAVLGDGEASQHADRREHPDHDQQQAAGPVSISTGAVHGSSFGLCKERFALNNPRPARRSRRRSIRVAAVIAVARFPAGIGSRAGFGPRVPPSGGVVAGTGATTTAWFLAWPGAASATGAWPATGTSPVRPRALAGSGAAPARPRSPALA